jgi:hypothetical protein
MLACTFDRSGLSPAPSDATRDRASDVARLDASQGLDQRSLERAGDGEPDRPGDGRRLEGPLPDKPRLDQARLDKPPPVDLAPKDKPPLKPDTVGCVTASFTSGLGPVQPKTGTWTLGGGVLRQTASGGGNYATIAGAGASNYAASALVTVHALHPKPGWIRGAALGVRLQAGSAGTPRQYLCGAYPGNQGLVVVHCSGGDPNTTCQVAAQAGPQVAIGQQVLVRATVVGSTLTCELPLLAGKLTYPTGGLTSGGPTLITQYADASYDDLSACPLP